MSTPRVPIAIQISEVQREIALRRNTYPRLVGSGKMKQDAADLCCRRMEAVLDTLLFCQANEADIRAYIRARREALARGDDA